MAEGEDSDRIIEPRKGCVREECRRNERFDAVEDRIVRALPKLPWSVHAG